MPDSVKMYTNPANKNQAYWRLIRWDACAYLTGHHGRHTLLYHDKVQPGLVQDVGSFARAILGGFVRCSQRIARSLCNSRVKPPLLASPYLLLITPGNAKYAEEEQQIIAACGRKGLPVLTAYPCPDGSVLLAADAGSPLSGELLTVLDCFRVSIRWIGSVLCGLPNIFSRDRKARSLFVSSIAAIRQYWVYDAFAHQIIKSFGRPRAVLSLCAASSMSVALVRHMKENDIVTAGVRTQSTSRIEENVAINTDLLFCKSLNEMSVYKSLFPDDGPRLEKGCLLSLPAVYTLEPLTLPQRYVLLLGTAPHANQSEEEYHAFNDNLFRVGAASGLPILFKGHDLAQKRDDAWFARHSGVQCVRISDVRRNRELMDHASLVVSAASTLTYYAILKQIPVIMVPLKNGSPVLDEFKDSPIRRVMSPPSDVLEPLDWSVLQDLARATTAWFEANYFMQNGSDDMVDFLLRTTRRGLGKKETEV